MRLVLVGLWTWLLSYTPAFGDTVNIGGKEFQTGLIRRPKGQWAETYHTPGTEALKDLPESYDARADGLVTPIKNQGQCGSCWAFARTKALEAAAIKRGKGTEETLDLAEQDTLVNDPKSYGCQGGMMDGSYEVDSGVTSEAYCPYRENDRVRCNKPKQAKAQKWSMVGAEGRAPTVDELREAIYTHGVIAVTVSASDWWNTDQEGRIAYCGARGINHMVTLVAYRPHPRGGYEFLIANSWGPEWGDKGYAWSRQGCSELASDPGDAALWFE
jgi:C1A family cysteine protease